MLAKPENRQEAVAKLFQSVGGKLIGWYLTFGCHDWLAIGEFPNEKVAAPAILERYASLAGRLAYRAAASRGAYLDKYDEPLRAVLMVCPCSRASFSSHLAANTIGLRTSLGVA
jgi:hypothetical protein